LSDAILELRALRCERDDRMLIDGLDVQLRAGEALQLRGANGAGKTTLLRCIAGLHPDHDGEIRIAGAAGSGMAGANMLFIGHRPGLSSGLTAAENLRWHQQLGGHAADSEAVSRALERVGLRGWDDVPCVQMSAGQQRRVALARMVLIGARVQLWLLDEPFTALDDDGVDLVVDLMRTHLLERGALVFATHQAVTDLPGLRTLRIDAGHARLEAA
jgi:heme exporter protein A